MSALEQLATQGLGVLAWLTVASTLVFAAVSLVGRLLPRPAAGLRHALLLLVLARLVMPPGVTSWLSAGQLLDALTSAHEPVSEAGGGEWLHAPILAAAGSGRSVTAAPGWSLGWFALWALLAAAVAGRRWRQRQRFRRLAAAGTPAVHGAPAMALARWQRRLGIRRGVRLVTVDAPVMPYTTGTLRPVIVLPEALVAGSEIDAASVEAVVAHELAHVKRLDDLWLVLEQVATALFFFHPVVWLTARALGTERELAADRVVLAAGALSPRSYGQALLHTLGLDFTTTTVAAAAGTRRRLTMRMRHIADPKTSQRPGRGQSLLAAAAVLLTAAVLLPPPASSHAAETVAAGPAPLPGAWSPWAPAPAGSPGYDDVMPGARVTSPFGVRRLPSGGEPQHHGGVDLSTGAETPVYAPRGGVVELAETGYGKDGRFGTVVIVDHGGGIKTFYAHLASLSVKVGDGVSAGDEIGSAGNTGVSSGPHLHFELWKDGDKVDPADMAEVLGAC